MPAESLRFSSAKDLNMAAPAEPDGDGPGGSASAGAVPAQRSAGPRPQGARGRSRPPGRLDRAADHRDRAPGVRGHRRGHRRAADRPAAGPPGRARPTARPTCSATLGVALVFAGRSVSGRNTLDAAVRQSTGHLHGRTLLRRGGALLILGHHREALEDLNRSWPRCGWPAISSGKPGRCRNARSATCRPARPGAPSRTCGEPRSCSRERPGAGVGGDHREPGAGRSPARRPAGGADLLRRGGRAIPAPRHLRA